MRVTESVGPAWEAMKRLLFRPFHLGTWLSFGLIFALQSCAEGGGSNGFRIPDLGNAGSGSGAAPRTSSAIESVLSGHLLSRASFPGIGSAEVLIIAVVVLALAIPLVLLLTWLGSRGQMMAIHSVATGDVDVGAVWQRTQASGGRMFKFHLVVTALMLAVLLPLVGIGAAVMVPAVRAGVGLGGLLLVLLPLLFIFVIALVPFLIARSLARNFVAPLMLKHDIGARDAWKRFWANAKGQIGSVVVFWLVGIGFAMAAGVVSVLAGFFTCCLGFLPILHQTLMAPYYVFERAWTLEILASMSPDFDLRVTPPNPYGGGPYGGYGGGTGGFGPGGYGPGGYGPGGYGPGGYGPGGAPPAGGFGSPPRG